MIFISKITGVYKITNNLTGEFYIGASVDIKSRYSTHMGRDARNYKGKHRFYDEILSYGRDNFELEILKECNKDELLTYEQYYFDLLQPTYNKVRPAIHNFIYEDVRKKASMNGNTKELVEERKRRFNSPEYKEFFRKLHTEKMKPVEMLRDNEVIKEFISMQEASRYISDHTDFKGKNKTSKIKAVCDGDRRTAYGYGWRYKKV